MAKAKPVKLSHIKMCVDRILTPQQRIKAMNHAIKVNPLNAPNAAHLPLGIASHPLQMALLTNNKWPDGKMLGVSFMNGTPKQIDKVKTYATEWCRYADIKLNFNAAPNNAEIRVAFNFNGDGGSWSYCGTECLAIEKNTPTMNYGWISDNSDEKEDQGVVLHEFGHALGCIHEHQNPKGGLKWNEEEVYKYFGGPPNFWSREDTFSNVIQKYELPQLNASEYDPDSIMLYAFDGRLIVGGKGTKENTKLSAGDKAFINITYPLIDFVSASLDGEGVYKGKAYLFEGGEYFRYDWKNDEVDKGFPLPLTAWKMPGNFVNGIDAALNGQGKYAGKAYFFKGGQYVRYDWKTNQLDQPPASLSLWNFPAGFQNGIDAAVNGVGKYAGKAYFFKGNKYIRYDWKTEKVDPGFPQSNTAWGLPTSFVNGIDAALNGQLQYEGKLYFFRGGQYLRYDWKTGKMDPGYPSTIAGNWY